MLDLISTHQYNIMLSLGNVCGVVALFMLLSGVHGRKKNVLFLLELCASIYIIADRYIRMYEGDLSPHGWWMTRVNLILVFEMNIGVLFAFNLYLKETFEKSRDLNPHLKRFFVNNVLLCIGTLIVILSAFTKLIYYYDEDNMLQTGRLAPLFTVTTLIVMILQMSLVIQFYKKLSKAMRNTLLLFALIPLLDPFIRAFMPDIATTNIAITIMALLLYFADLMDTNATAAMSLQAMAENTAKSAFLSNMSHEIRTPLNTLLGMNEMVLRESDDPAVIGYSENIRSAGNTLLGLINDILDFSKIEAGRIEIIPVDYDLSSVINDLVNMIAPRAEKKGLKLILDIDKQIPKLLHGDEIRIKQVITNILTNAVKYTREGSVTFKMGFEWLEKPYTINLIVSVSDTGIGIKEEDLEKLFSEFERIEEKRNRNVEGTGLGMSITKSLLQMMDSAISVESVYGKGSTFSFQLKQKVIGKIPLGDYASVNIRQINSHKKYTEKLFAPTARILVVDDNAMNLEVFQSLIKLTLIQTETAASGYECLEMTKNKKYDLIFLDHMMTGLDGVETLQKLKEQTDGVNYDTPAICLTANAVSGAREKYIAAGFDDYLTKPINYSKLEDMLIRYLPKEKVTLDQSVEKRRTEADAGEQELPESIALLENDDLIDISAGMENSGSAEDYLSLLNLFYQALPEKTGELERLYAEGDLDSYTIKVHALKSSLKIIGAKDLAGSAQLLENAGKSENTGYIDGHQKDFLNRLERLKKSLSDALPSAREESETSAAEKALADEDLMTMAISELKAAAENMDIDRLDMVFYELREYRIPEDRAPLFAELKKAVASYDYKKILTLLEQE